MLWQVFGCNGTEENYLISDRSRSYRRGDCTADKLDHYRCLIRRVITSSPYYLHGSTSPNVDTVLLCDEEHDNYLLMDIGWQEQSRVKRMILFVRIKNHIIWIEEDWTEAGIAEELVRAGIPQEDVVLAFQPPNVRRYTEYAVP